MESERKNMMMEISDCMTLPDNDRSDCSSNWISVSGILDTCFSVKVGRKAEKPVFFNPLTIEVTMVPIWSMLPYNMFDEIDSTSRITRRTQRVMKVTDTDGFTIPESRLWKDMRATAMAADQINTVMSGQKTRIQTR
jgi:hypothetical protein